MGFHHAVAGKQAEFHVDIAAVSLQAERASQVADIDMGTMVANFQPGAAGHPDRVMHVWILARSPGTASTRWILRLYPRRIHRKDIINFR
jgi:hypothetical protein